MTHHISPFKAPIVRDQELDADECVASIFDTTTTSMASQEEAITRCVTPIFPSINLQTRYTPITPCRTTDLRALATPPKTPHLQETNKGWNTPEDNVDEEDKELDVEDELVTLLQGASLQSFGPDDEKNSNKLMPALSYEENQRRNFKPVWIGIMLDIPTSATTDTPRPKRNNMNSECDEGDVVPPSAKRRLFMSSSGPSSDQ